MPAANGTAAPPSASEAPKPVPLPVSREALVLIGISLVVTAVVWSYVHWVVRVPFVISSLACVGIAWHEFRYPDFPRPHIGLRFTNWAFGLCGLNRWGLLIPLSMEVVHSKASKRAGGLTDFGDNIDGYSKRLERYIECLHRDAGATAQVTFLGRLGLREDIIRRLHQRLLVVQTLNQHRKEIDEQQIIDPIIVTGCPRTGTSILSRLMSDDPNNAPLIAYESRCPGLSTEHLKILADPTQPDPRIKAVEAYANRSPHLSSARLGRARSYDRVDLIRRSADSEVNFVRMINPAVNSVHEIGATIHEECVFLLLNSFAVLVQYEHFDQWLTQLTESDPHALDGAYDFYKLQLQVLQWQRAIRFKALHPDVTTPPKPKRWLLKYPAHVSQMDQLLRVFPGVKIVWTHRVAREVIPSMCSLLLQLCSLVENPYRDVASHGQTVLRMLSRQHQIACAKSKRISSKHLLPVAYTDTTSDPVGTVARIYRHFGISWDEGLRDRLQRYMIEHPKNKFGEHKYSAAQFQLAPDTIDRTFAEAEAKAEALAMNDATEHNPMAVAMSDGTRNSANKMIDSKAQ